MQKISKFLCMAITLFFGYFEVSLAQGIPDLSGLDYETKSSIQIACVSAKT